MDHLPLVVGSAVPPLEVPCVCDPRSFDGLHFEDFPSRKGFRLISQDAFPKFILKADGSRLNVQALAEITQAWLFFGLLIAVFKVSGVAINPIDFLKHEGDGSRITMRALPGYLSEWEQKESLLSAQERKAHFRRQQQMMVISTFFRLHQMTGQYWQDGLLSLSGVPKEHYKVTLPLSIEISITILGETLDRASRRVFGNLNRMSSGVHLQDRDLINELRFRAWCPSEVSLVMERLDDTSAFFASQVQRRRLEADHTKCSINKCLAFNIVAESYETKHIDGCLGCKHVGIDKEDLASVLRQGLIPRTYLHSVNACPISDIKLEIRASGPYIAISHVWSDGLGNANGNSLPLCQLLRLRSIAATLKIQSCQEVPAIWIDSLLVPTEKGFEKRLALSRLCDYYRRADKVLVLDSDLLQASQACSKEEIMIRILFSTWMRRLWTLEEGILSRENLMFLFCDGTVSMSHLLDSSQFRSSITAIGDVVERMMLALLPDLSEYYIQPPKGIQDPILDRLLPILEYRSTTKAIDETLCIAHILRMDTSLLLEIEDVHRRMKAFIELLAQQQQLFPMRLLFTKEPKLSLVGFRWAPTSFMALDHEDISYLRGDFRKYWTGCNGKGLLISGMSGFTLSFGNHTFKKATFAEVDKKIYGLIPVPTGKSCRDSERFYSPQILNEIDPVRQWNAEVQEMLGKSPQTTAVIWESATYALLVSRYGLEGKVQDPEGSLLYARPICQLYMQELKTKSCNYAVCGADSSVIKFGTPDWDFDEQERQMHETLAEVHEPKTSTFLRCRAIDPSQRWCIG